MPPPSRSEAHRPPVEMTGDGRFARRVVRLALTSMVALGLIWFLSVSTVDAHVAIPMSLLAGWILMPSVLGLSLRWSVLRYALLVPASLVGLALVAICISALPRDPASRAGWLLITAGVLFGGGLGSWFWFRWMPVPHQLHDPFSSGRWVLVAAHVLLIITGLVLVGASALAGS